MESVIKSVGQWFQDCLTCKVCTKNKIEFVQHNDHRRGSKSVDVSSVSGTMSFRTQEAHT